MKDKNSEHNNYKMTELGPLPEEWGVVKLGDVADFSKKPRNVIIKEDEEIPFMAMDMISETSQLVKGWSMKKYSQITSGTFVFKDDIVIAKITPCFENGKQAILSNLPTDFAYMTTEVWVFHPNQNELVKSEHIFNYLRIPKVRHFIATKMEGTTGRQRIPKSVISSLKIPLPPLPEQQRIAAVLSSVQEAREKTEVVIQAAGELKRSMMKHLFTYGPVPPSEADSVPLKETEIGMVPVGWDVNTFGNFGKFQYGYTESANDKEIGPKFLRITDIDLETSLIKWSGVPFCSITDDDFQKYCLSEGDILIARIGATTGKSCIIKNPPRSVFASYLIRFISKHSILNPYFFHYFMMNDQYWSQINAGKEGKLKKGVSSSQLKNFLIPLPPLPEQKRIAAVLSSIDDKIQAEENKKKAQDDLFKTLLNDLMTAKVRVNDLDIKVDGDEIT